MQRYGKKKSFVFIVEKKNVLLRCLVVFFFGYRQMIGSGAGGGKMPSKANPDNMQWLSEQHAEVF